MKARVGKLRALSDALASEVAVAEVALRLTQGLNRSAGIAVRKCEAVAIYGQDLADEADMSLSEVNEACLVAVWTGIWLNAYAHWADSPALWNEIEGASAPEAWRQVLKRRYD